jgi:hypothetical protein
VADHRTSKFVAPSFSDFLGAVGQGDFLSDTVTIGGVTAKNLTFGYVDVYANPSHQFPPIASIAGTRRLQMKGVHSIQLLTPTSLGFSTNCYGLGPECGNAGAYLMQGLKNKSVIDRQSVSMYLGPDIWNTTAAQMILGGYYDSSKFAGPRVTVAMTDPFNQITSNGQTNSVNVTRLTVTQKDNSKTSQAYNNSGSGEPVLIDSGAPTIFLPQTLANAVLKAFGNASKSNGGIVPAYVVDCKYQTEYSGTFTAEFEGGASVTVPLSDWVTKFKDGTCATYVFAIGDGPQLRSFGDPWLRSVYTIFDQEAKRLTMGPVKHTKSVTYEKIPSGGFPVTKGKGYSSKGY